MGKISIILAQSPNLQSIRFKSLIFTSPTVISWLKRYYEKKNRITTIKIKLGFLKFENWARFLEGGLILTQD